MRSEHDRLRRTLHNVSSKSPRYARMDEFSLHRSAATGQVRPCLRAVRPQEIESGLGGLGQAPIGLGGVWLDGPTNH